MEKSVALHLQQIVSTRCLLDSTLEVNQLRAGRFYVECHTVSPPSSNHKLEFSLFLLGWVILVNPLLV